MKTKRRLPDYPIERHDALTKAIRTLEDDLRAAFREADAPEPRINALYYNPRLQAFYHFMPFWIPERTLAGTGNSPYFALFSDTKGPFLSQEELRDIAQDAFRKRHALTAATRLVADPHFSAIDELKVRTARDLVWVLLNKVNVNDMVFIRKVEKAHCLHEAVHILLSVLPQISDTQHAYFHRGMESYGWKNASWKETQLTKLLRDFASAQASLSFRSRLFLLLSLIESLQWSPGDTFGIIGDVYRFIVNNPPSSFCAECAHPVSLDHETKLLQQNAYLLRLVSLYFYGDYSKDPFTTKPHLRNRVRNVLFGRISLWTDQVMGLVMDHHRDEMLAFGEIRRDRPSALAHGLLNILSPNEIAIGQLEDKTCKFFLSAYPCERYIRAQDQTLEHITAKQLFNAPWGSFVQNESPTTIDITLPSTLEPFFHYDEERIVGFLGPQEDGLRRVSALVMDGADTFDDVHSTKLALAEFAGRINDIHESLSAYDRPQWFEKAFHNMYYYFDTLRQSRDPARAKEVDFLLGLLKNAGGGQDGCLVVDLGSGYGRVANEIARKTTTTRLVCLELSSELIDIHRSRLDMQIQDRIEIRHVDFRNLVDSTAAPTNADMVVLMFTTYGGLSNESEDRQLLRVAYQMLRPGGVLVIEQFNPERVRNEPEPPLVLRANPNGDRTVLLHKVSFFTRAPDTDFTLYHGTYHYSAPDDPHQPTLEINDYRLRLYTLKWFEERARELPGPPDVVVCGDFDHGRYQRDNSQLLIIRIKKPLGTYDNARIQRANRWIAMAKDCLDSYEIPRVKRMAAKLKVDDGDILDRVIQKNLDVRYAYVFGKEGWQRTENNVRQLALALEGEFQDT